MARLRDALARMLYRTAPGRVEGLLLRRPIRLHQALQKARLDSDAPAEAVRDMLAEIEATRRELDETDSKLWFNEHRPHAALDGRTPKEMLEGAAPPRQRARIEPRARMPLRATEGVGPPRAPRPLRGRLELVVGYLGGRPELPVVDLREAA